jgi:hypothetical protein
VLVIWNVACGLSAFLSFVAFMFLDCKPVSPVGGAQFELTVGIAI